MANLIVKDLVESKELDSKAMSAVRGGSGIGHADLSNWLDANFKQKANQNVNTDVVTGGFLSPAVVIVDADQTQKGKQRIDNESYPRLDFAKLASFALA